MEDQIAGHFILVHLEVLEEEHREVEILQPLEDPEFLVKEMLVEEIIMVSQVMLLEVVAEREGLVVREHHL